MKNREAILQMFTNRILGVSLNSNYAIPARLRYIEFLLESWAMINVQDEMQTLLEKLNE